MIEIGLNLNQNDYRKILSDFSCLDSADNFIKRYLPDSPGFKSVDQNDEIVGTYSYTDKATVASKFNDSDIQAMPGVRFIYQVRNGQDFQWYALLHEVSSNYQDIKLIISPLLNATELSNLVAFESQLPLGDACQFYFTKKAEGHWLYIRFNQDFDL